MLVVLLFGLNRHLFHARWFWLVSAVMMGIHIVLVKLLYKSIANANAWMILGILLRSGSLCHFPTLGWSKSMVLNNAEKHAGSGVGHWADGCD
jgi:hypothetical protein